MRNVHYMQVVPKVYGWYKYGISIFRRCNQCNIMPVFCIPSYPLFGLCACSHGETGCSLLSPAGNSLAAQGVTRSAEQQGKRSDVVDVRSHSHSQANKQKKRKKGKRNQCCSVQLKLIHPLQARLLR